MAINKISDVTKQLIREQSVLSLPDRPSEKGYTASQLKEYFTNLVLGHQGALTEIDRIVDEINELVGDISDTTIKNYVLDSIVSKLVEQSPYIGLSIVDNKLKYTKFGSPNITGELDYIPEDSVFFNGEYLTNKSKENILPKTTIDKLIDIIDDKTVREYILYLNSRINELLEKHNSEISTINSNIEAILGGDAPDALNSIKELAEALKNNPSQVDNILLQLSGLNSGKVDKIEGKQLSTNDYDNASKSFVDSLKIKNLVEVENLKTDLKQFNDDSEHRLVTDVEKATWNSKANSIHSHEINDVNGLLDSLNSKSASNHTHTADDIGAEKIGVAATLIDSHNKSTTAHEDIRKTLSELTNKVDGINSAISFGTELELSNWLSGNFTRSDGLNPSNLFIGQHIYIKEQDENDYWVSIVPVSSISDLSVLPTDKINLEEYALLDELKRVAFTGSYKDLIDLPTIPSSLAEMTEDENHKVITQEKLTLIDTNASNILNKLDKNLGSSEANKMLITDSNGNIITAIAGSMSALIDGLDSTSTTMAPTANQVRILNNNKLDKQQGTENANKYLYVNSLGLIDLAAIKTKLSEFENDNSYQTLTEVEKLISAIPTPDVSGQIENHNNDEEAHEDIRNSIPVVTNDLTNELKKNYDAAYTHSKSLHAPTTTATTSANGLMSSADKTNVDANTTARHTHSNKSVLDGITADSLSKYAKTSGGNTFTGIQHVAGTAADKPFWVRGIQGCMSDGITEGELHLNYQSNHPVKWGYNANGTLNADGGATFAGDITVGKVTIFNENNGSIEIGDRTGTYSTPYIDFHTNIIDTDYDVRIIAKNENIGTTSTGQGYLEIEAKKLLINGSLYQNGKSLLDLIYPVGSIYMSTAYTSPASFLGGTWVQLKDTFLLAHGDTYTSTKSNTASQVKAEAGSATHTLTTSEMPSHNHQGLYWQNSSYGVSLDSGSANRIYMNHSWTANSNTTNLYTGNTGSGSAHNNMPPYLVVYMWKRTA